MENVSLQANSRTDNGKGVCRRLRAEGLIPAVVYGMGSAPQSLTVSPKLLSKIMLSKLGLNSVIELKIDDKAAVSAMVHEYQYHPVTRELVHADFVQIDVNAEIDVDVPLVFTGKPKGVVMGGILRQIYRTVPLRCKPALVPSSVEVDISNLKIEEFVLAGNLPLTEGVVCRYAADRSLGGVYSKGRRGAAEEETEEGAAAGKKPAAKGKK